MSALIDLALLCVALEALVLRRRPDLLRTLLAGLGLLVALRLAVADAAPAWVLLALSAAGACHLLDLRARWRASPTLPLPLPQEKTP